MQQWVAFWVGQHLCALLPQNVMSVCRSVSLTIAVCVALNEWATLREMEGIFMEKIMKYLNIRIGKKVY